VEFFLDLLRGGVDGLVEYLSAHVITCLVPALFIGVAIAAGLPLGRGCGPANSLAWLDRGEETERVVEG